MTFGERVRARREQLDMTQDELAKKLGYKSRSSVNKIELDQRNMKQSQIVSLANALQTTPGYLMGWKENEHPIPSNIFIPAAHGIPILGTICCGDGIYAEQNYDGMFFVDSSIKADCCLHVHGDSMIDAGIRDGDIAFIQKGTDIDDGDICGIVLRDSNEAVLKKIFKSDGHLILQPCNTQYKPIIEDPDNVLIVGEMVGVYHKMK
jgi:repressor LexA